MNRGRPPHRARIVPAGLLLALGVGLSSVHIGHGVAELEESYLAVLTGVLLPLVVSLAVCGGGVWVLRRDWDAVSPWRLVLWVLGGVMVAELFAGLLVLYQLTHGVYLNDLVFVATIHMSYGAALGMVVGIYDLRVRETRLRLMRKSQRLDNFASIVSHDLRNPLNVVEGRIDLARETGEITHLDPLPDAIDRMRTIIRETLTLARQGEQAISEEPIDLREASRDAWSMIDVDESTIEIEGDVTVLADPDRLRTVLENLFRNAVQHNPSPVTVTVGPLDDGKGFYVADTGTGIPADRRERIFEGGYSTDTGGTGLGLAIVRAAADSHGWAIAVDVGPSGGSRFEFRGVELS